MQILISQEQSRQMWQSNTRFVAVKILRLNQVDGRTRILSQRHAKMFGLHQVFHLVSILLILVKLYHCALIWEDAYVPLKKLQQIVLQDQGAAMIVIMFGVQRLLM
jgi:hypothetical protein